MSTSSRWKRFAFFERKNLSLPPSVVRDLIPTTKISVSLAGGRGGKTNVDGGGKNDNDDDPLDPKSLYRNDNDREEDDELTDEECNAIGCGEYFSLVAASDVAFNANDDDCDGGIMGKVPAGMKPRRDGGGLDGISAMSAGIVALHAAARDNVTSSSVGAMAGKGNGGTEAVADGKLQLLFASSRNTSLVHCIDVTARCTPINPLLVADDGGGGDGSDATFRGGKYENNDNNRGSSGSGDVANNIEIKGNAFALSSDEWDIVNKKQRSASASENNISTTNIEAYDGWRGQYDPFSSCDGFVVAATPVVCGSGAASSTASTSRPTTSTSATKVGTAWRKASSSTEQRVLDEHLGGGVGSGEGGGSGRDNASTASSLFASSPFANDYYLDMSRQHPRPPSAMGREKARIVGLATTICSVYQSKSSSSSSKPTPPHHPAKEKRPRSSRHHRSSTSSILFVAAITDSLGTVGVVVHANPHLMLSSSLAPSTASTVTDDAALRGTSRSWCYRPSTYDFEKHGKPTCVTVMPGVACIGTDFGVVLVYVFPIDRPGHSGGHGPAANGADNVNCGQMSLVAEIPAPRWGDAIDDGRRKTNMHAASSVHLIGPSASSSFVVDDGRGTTASTGGGDASYGVSSKAGGGGNGIHRLFVTYRKRIVHSRTTHVRQEGRSTSSSSYPGDGNIETPLSSSSTSSAGGVCCYDLGGLRIPGNSPTAASGAPDAPVVSARYDMDGRDVSTSCVCDGIDLPPGPLLTSKNDVKDKSGEDATNSSVTMEKMLPRYAVARNDGLHLYSHDERVGVCPIDGNKIAICSLPPPPVVHLRRPVRRAPPTSAPSDDGANGVGSSASSSGGPNDDWTVHGAGATYTLVATTDFKSGRDAVDVYDTTNKLVGFHVLLSPGHRALRAVGVFSSPVVGSNTLLCGGRSSAVVLTSGGSIVTLTERATPEKIDLLIQKNLFPTAISMAFSDPQFFRAEDIVKLYRRYAEHLYRKGDFSAAMDQYILTIGSLESSHVLFRFLDAPKIYLAVRYLVRLRAAGLASSVHEDLLRTCYLKLGDIDAASKIILAQSSSSPQCDAAAPFLVNPNEALSVPISRNLLACVDEPSEMLSAICSLNSAEATEALVAHGVSIARSLPRETAGVVIALCEGTYSPSVVDDAAGTRNCGENTGGNLKCDKYPMSLFVNAFMENPKLLRLILSHCRRNGNNLTPMLRRSLLELTLDEWNSAKRIGDVHAQKLRRDEAIMLLSDNRHVDDMGDYETLVIVQAAGFSEGILLLYERLNMIHMLLEQYARSGTDRARRQMLAMCEHRDPEIFADVLSHFVNMTQKSLMGDPKEEASVESESEIGGLLHDIHEALVMAIDHGDLPPVRILRILAGEGRDMFTSDRLDANRYHHSSGVPLAAALDYVNAVLDDCSSKICRLKNNVEQCGALCDVIEHEINCLLSPGSLDANSQGNKWCNIDEIYSNICRWEDEKVERVDEVRKIETSREDFWREMEHSEDHFETICFCISKGYLRNL